MKKILSLVLCCLFLLGFSCCDPGVTNLDKDDLIDNTVNYHFEEILAIFLKWRFS